MRRPRQHGCGLELACFLHFQNITALVGAALGAGAMRLLAFVAVGALGEADGGQPVMLAALGGAGLGVTPLWICHYRFPFLPACRAAYARSRLAKLLKFTRTSGISLLMFDPAAQTRQSGPTWIGRCLFTRAGLRVQMRSAMRTKPLATVAAQGFRRQRKKHLLSQDVLQKNTVS